MKQYVLLSAVIAGNIGASEYTTLANTVKITDSEIIIHMLKIGEDDPSCMETGVSFPIGEAQSNMWFETIVLSRTQQQLLDFVYDETTCVVQSISMPEIYGDAGGGNVADGALDETGLYGNVALLGTNGLGASSIDSSPHHSTDEAAAAFDGYLYTQHFNEDSEEKIARGIWMTRLRDNADELVEPWVSVDFSQAVTLNGVGIFINPQSLSLGRLPRFVTLLVSEDGEEYEEAFEFSLRYAESNEFTFQTEVSYRFFKLRFENNFGDEHFIEVDEIEFYQ